MVSASALAYTGDVSSPGGARALHGTWLLLTLGTAAVLQLVVVNFWARFESPNERARAYQAFSLVSRGSLEIGAEVERFGGLEDVAIAGGRLFPDKAPGTLPLLLPGALLAHRLAAGDPEGELRLTLVLGRLLAASLPFGVCVLLLARLTASLPRGGPLAVAAYALGTPALASSVLLFSHALTACLLLAGFLLLFRSPRPRWQPAMLAGLLLGWAAVCEYPVAVPAAVLVLVAVPRLGLRGSLALAFGGGVPLALLGAYNAACFGSPFALSSAHEAYGPFAVLVRQGLFGISWPTLGGLAGLLFSSSRGLVVWAPLVALAVLGALARPRWPEDVGARVALTAAPLVLLLVMSGYPNWHGFWFPGPRYLLPVLPLIFVLAARGAESALERPWGRVLVALGRALGVGTALARGGELPVPTRGRPAARVHACARTAGRRGADPVVAAVQCARSRAGSPGVARRPAAPHPGDTRGPARRAARRRGARSGCAAAREQGLAARGAGGPPWSAP